LIFVNAIHAYSQKKYPKAEVVVDIRSTLSLKETFEYMVPMDLEHIFNEPYKNIPSIDSTSNQEAWFTAGQKRVIFFNDGSTSQEELLSVMPSSGFTYKVYGFTSPLKILIKQINGSWVFTETGEGKINIKWTYEFIPKHFLARFLVKTIVAKRIKTPMQNALNIMKKELESGNLYQYSRRVGNW